MPETVPGWYPAPKYGGRGSAFYSIGCGSDPDHEDVCRYRRGGFHPVIIGDILPKPLTCSSDSAKPPRYHIRRKLGNGAFSTVWLARDLEQDRWVALKVCVGSEQADWSTETLILRHLQTVDGGKRAHPTVLELYDSFIVEGPNGFHNCLVTEPVCTLGNVNLRLNPPYSPDELVSQIAAGFARLHQEGIAHGDPHSGNFGISLPRIQEVSEEALFDYFGCPGTTVLVPRAFDFPRDTAPLYVVDADTDLGQLARHKEYNLFPSRDEVSVRILDFGRAFWIDKIPPSLPGCVPFGNRPPEIFIFEVPEGTGGTKWTQAADIWALGPLFCYIKNRASPIPTQAPVNITLTACFKFGGRPPPAWLETWNSREVLWPVDLNAPPPLPPPPPPPPRTPQPLSGMARLPGTRSIAGVSIVPEEVVAPTVDPFQDLLKKMMVTLPEERLTMAQVLAHPFFTGDT